MRPVSVKELAELLNRAVAENKGDYIVLVECNGYHQELWDKVNITQGDDVQFREGGEWKLRNSIVLS